MGIVKRAITTALIMALLMLPAAAADKGELPFGLQWGMTKEEAAAVFAAVGITLQHGVTDNVLYSEAAPLLPGFLFPAYLNFYPLGKPGYNDGQLRLQSCNLIIHFQEGVSNAEQQAKGKEIIEALSEQFGVPPDDELPGWLLGETKVFLFQSIGQGGSVQLHYEGPLSLE